MHLNGHEIPKHSNKNLPNLDPIVLSHNYTITKIHFGIIVYAI